MPIEFTKAEKDAKPFLSSDTVRMTKAEWLAKIESPDRIVACKTFDVDGKLLMVWSFYAGHENKIYKSVMNGDAKVHEKYHGRLVYAKTKAEAEANQVLHENELVGAGYKESK